MADSDLEELTDIRTLIDVRSVSPEDKSEDDRTNIPSPYKSYTFSETSRGSTESSTTFPASPFRPESHSLRFEKIYYMTDTESTESVHTEEQRRYSRDSFEAATVSERSSLASQSESELSYSESWEEVASQESEDEIANALQEQFIEMKLHHLNSIQRENIHDIEELDKEKIQTTTKLPAAARKFCKKKVEILRSPPVKSKDPKVSKRKKRTVKHGTDKDQHIDNRLLHRLKLQNLMEKMQKAARVEIHNPHKCQICCCAREFDALGSFVKSKTVIAESKAMDQRIEKHLMTHDSVTLIGQLANTLPKPTEDPQKIWQKMMQGIS
ncbi:uncharacterized protein C8orf48 homolog [Glandiceps talaboti]